MNQREYEKLKRQFKEEYDQKLAALELIYRASNKPDNTFQKPKKSTSSLNGERAPRTPGIKETVRNILPEINKDFTLHDVEDKLAESDSEIAAKIKKASLSSVLKRLEAEGDIVIVERGTGKRPSIYRLAGSHGMAGESVS